MVTNNRCLKPMPKIKNGNIFRHFRHDYRGNPISQVELFFFHLDSKYKEGIAWDRQEVCSSEFIFFQKKKTIYGNKNRCLK